MKKHFLITDNDSNLGVFEYSTNEEADRLIMQIVCEYYCTEDCHLDHGFKIENCSFKYFRMTGQMLDNGEDTNYEIYIEQIGVYSTKK
ncbi:hypothetical protein Phi4:1_gp135 [Cellulophaga phage phi4:1]|uniref:Uncharacterized protein n=5 Tax=Lightbulbvirus TaxID=1918522 RepID=A0A0S2MWP2_9CAUD|nr:hypothetical protein Phi4:1_gp135 [Cellulophaga phage phi4:1]YP_008241634.1 hypothetical protein Phi17:2_gp139 [Cellulophaga phage phi17:2]ALO80144.1 hypothetical protein Phi4113_135 [Cellulophaga phage phi4:1_13]ALO80341.1 hypothetical protein Phi4118_135 [Cellulophaga phage phi4:1_18]ALO80542.1 hypothetical protein Phi17218_139 [Cellulophaga phage phi17:2_18]AGO47672.1 hypothetical protein Phi17:2_gp139 [Cellulophaga phage phi17:2]AGO49548.1 hypothetical protein Phi4:1_gp135 [Cellulophag